jgi:CheY-like chemotaxis protein
MDSVPQTLLLADDSVTIQRFIELTFADEDISVIAVGNGDHAIATIRHSPPDIVLADVGMPGRSGYEVARHVKHTPALAHIPVLLLTGAFEPIDQTRAVEVGCDGVLTKPFEPQVVVRRVKELLSASRPGSAPPRPFDDVGTFERSRVAEGSVARLDDYFERLDQAFAARLADPPPPEPERPWPPLMDARDRFGSGTPPAQTSTVSDRSLAGAFSALLAAEQAGSAADAFTDWVSSAPESAASAPQFEVTDALIDTIVRRVLDRLSDTVVRDAVAALASTTAERLVREEIERIKSNIK